MIGRSSGPPPHFIVLIPGFMGSKLRHRMTGEIVWLDIASILSDPLEIPQALDNFFCQMKYPNDELEPAGIMDQVVFLPPLFKQEHYQRLTRALAAWGYDLTGNDLLPGKPKLYEFAYDWRQDNRTSARQLGEAIQRWQADNPGAKAWLIGHSNGGIVARWYIEKEGGHEHVSRLFLMGSPWDGAPKTMQVLMDGLDVFLLRLFNHFHVHRMVRDLILSFPSFYQLFPSRSPFLQDEFSHDIDPYENPIWLDNDEQRQMLIDGKKFNDELGTSLSVETLCFFGVKHETTTGGIVHLGAGQEWTSIDWIRTEAGDGTVPQHSAIHPQASQILPFSAGHGDIYVVQPVLDKLEYELITKFQLGVQATARTTRFQVTFEPEKDAFAPYETISIWARIQELTSGDAVSGAEISVHLEWGQGLPGVNNKPAQILSSVVLTESTSFVGRYEGVLSAPDLPGYYRLVATVTIENEDNIILEELILVDQD